MIRLAAPDDLAAIKTFNVFGGDRAREIAENRMLVMEEAGQVVGYVSWLISGFVGHDFITYLCVAPSFRRRGIAVRLLRAVEARIGAGRLFVSTEEDNAVMLALLPREGWTLAGAVKGANTGDRAEVFFYKDLDRT